MKARAFMANIKRMNAYAFSEKMEHTSKQELSERIDSLRKAFERYQKELFGRSISEQQNDNEFIQEYIEMEEMTIVSIGRFRQQIAVLNEQTGLKSNLDFTKQCKSQRKTNYEQQNETMFQCEKVLIERLNVLEQNTKEIIRNLKEKLDMSEEELQQSTKRCNEWRKVFNEDIMKVQNFVKSQANEAIVELRAAYKAEIDIKLKEFEQKMAHQIVIATGQELLYKELKCELTESIERLSGLYERVLQKQNVEASTSMPMGREDPASSSEVESGSILRYLVEIGQFNGRFKDWADWKVKYDEHIHNNQNMSATEKTTWLLKLLDEPSSRWSLYWIKNGADYEEVYHRLDDTYTSRDLFFIENLDELERFGSDRVREIDNIKGLISVSEQIIERLKCAEYAEGQWQQHITSCILSGMTQSSRAKWESTYDGDIPPNYLQVLKFLSERAALLGKKVAFKEESHSVIEANTVANNTRYQGRHSRR